MVALLLPFVQDQQWHGSVKWLLVPAALVVLAGFLGWERRHHQPLLDLSLFRLRSYALGSMIALLYFAGFTSIFFIFTLYLQIGLHYGALLAGLATTPFALGSAVGSTVGGRLVVRFGRPLVVAGLALVAVGLAATFLTVRAVPGDARRAGHRVPLLVGGIGSGLVISPNQALTLSEVDRRAAAAPRRCRPGSASAPRSASPCVLAQFFSALRSEHGDFAAALSTSMHTTVAFVVLALALGVVELVVSARRRSGQEEPVPSASARAD